MTSRASSFWRLVGGDGVIHLARGSDALGMVLCGYERGHGSEAVMEIARPGQEVLKGRIECPDCARIAVT